MLNMFGMIVAEVKSVSGKPLWEVQRNGQTLSEPYKEEVDALEYRLFLAGMRGSSVDPLADYWADVEAGRRA